jgi:hypothetical protein
MNNEQENTYSTTKKYMYYNDQGNVTIIQVPDSPTRIRLEKQPPCQKKIYLEAKRNRYIEKNKVLPLLDLDDVFQTMNDNDCQPMK